MKNKMEILEFDIIIFIMKSFLISLVLNLIGKKKWLFLNIRKRKLFKFRKIKYISCKKLIT